MVVDYITRMQFSMSIVGFDKVHLKDMTLAQRIHGMNKMVEQLKGLERQVDPIWRLSGTQWPIGRYRTTSLVLKSGMLISPWIPFFQGPKEDTEAEARRTVHDATKHVTKHFVWEVGHNSKDDDNYGDDLVVVVLD